MLMQARKENDMREPENRMSLPMFITMMCGGMFVLITMVPAPFDRWWWKGGYWHMAVTISFAVFLGSVFLSIALVDAFAEKEKKEVAPEEMKRKERFLGICIWTASVVAFLVLIASGEMFPHWGKSIWFAILLGISFLFAALLTLGVCSRA
jgi:hypothetical protein